MLARVFFEYIEECSTCFGKWKRPNHFHAFSVLRLQRILKESFKIHVLSYMYYSLSCDGSAHNMPK